MIANPGEESDALFVDIFYFESLEAVDQDMSRVLFAVQDLDDLGGNTDLMQVLDVVLFI